MVSSLGFEDFKLNKDLLRAIKEMGFSTPTKIQEKTIPLLLQGKDVVGHSQTGSGKTAAFALPIIEKIIVGQGARALVLTPTRELAVQVKEEIEKMSKYSNIKSVVVHGGVGYTYQTEGAKNSEIIIATPGRLIDHLERRTISLNKIEFVVLDEADRMLDMGFEKSVTRILAGVPKQKQVIMFSATMPIAAQRMIKKYMKSPVYVETEKQIHVDLLKHSVYKINREHKFSLLIHLLKNANGTAIVFCRTKRETDKIAKNLRKQGLKVRPVHGDLTQNKRQYAVNEFKEGKIDTLVATDVAARGLHIHGVSHVYNYDVPDNADDYTHRIGRTARAGMKGDAVTILCDRDNDLFRNLIKAGLKIQEKPLPEFEKVILVKDSFNLPRSEKRRQVKGEWEDRVKQNSSFVKHGNKNKRTPFVGQKFNKFKKRTDSLEENASNKFGGFKNRRQSFGENSEKDSNKFKKNNFRSKFGSGSKFGSSSKSSFNTRSGSKSKFNSKRKFDSKRKFNQN
jgi:ATP-dependent RNA helicase DeaD